MKFAVVEAVALGVVACVDDGVFDEFDADDAGGFVGAVDANGACAAVGVEERDGLVGVELRVLADFVVEYGGAA